ncbi:DUF1772 domain-containing protein [Nocardia sp. BSTN01]|uniref:DUF1772 domain-containing protein n=1 Tax=Nocardia sp. BSTN01 TaxID=2783665 RepID=UPI00188ECE21|nr:DUF1772 domain-containing protein [Nocardia sp. BSTN01]MBF5002394.1 DUF1772 domain-containing protein [Nocardia sp. BSTN01]
METVVQILLTVAIVGTAAVYGTDVFSSFVLRPALTHLSDAEITSAMGHMHRIADKRMPFPGVIGGVAAVIAATGAGFDGDAFVSVAAALGFAFVVPWLMIYARVAAPVNKALAKAATEGQVATDTRALQATWDSVINARVALQGAALLALCIALVASAS